MLWLNAWLSIMPKLLFSKDSVLLEINCSIHFAVSLSVHGHPLNGLCSLPAAIHAAAHHVENLLVMFFFFVNTSCNSRI